MFDIGGWEFLVIVLVAIIVIGPKDLPGVIRGVSQWVAKARELAREFRNGLDELSREVELDKLGHEVRSAVGVDELHETANSIRGEIDGTGHMVEISADPARVAGDDDEDALTAFGERSDSLPPDIVPPEAQTDEIEDERGRDKRPASNGAARAVAPPPDDDVEVAPPPAGAGAVPGR